MKQENLFYGGDCPKNKKGSYYWITTRLIRESGPWNYRPIIQSPEDVCEIMQEQMDLANADKEHFVVLYLDRKGNINAIETVSVGGLHSSIVHPREVFKPAILTSSASVILVHNHPSGDATPSREDIDVTRRLIEAGSILGIEVLDHVIIGERHISLKEQNLL